MINAILKLIGDIAYWLGIESIADSCYEKLRSRGVKLEW